MAAGRSGQALLVALLAAALFAVPSSAGRLAAPVSTSFTPTAGAVGATVSVNGSGFTGATDFYFNGVAAAFSVTSDVQIMATVPWGATDGPLKVVTPGGSGTSATEFKVKPKIAGFTPTSGPVGTSVSIAGSAFTGATQVAFNGAAASFHVASYSEIDATVPTGATTGPIKVTTPGGSSTSADSFTVTSVPPPTLRLSRSSGPPTSAVDVQGVAFGAFELVDVYFDTADLGLASTDANGAFPAVTIKVLAGAVPGTHWISAVGRRTGLSAQSSFLVQTNWPQFRNDAKRKGFDTTENVLSRGTVAGLDLDWSSDPTGGHVNSAPAVANGVVYVGSDDDKLYAYPTFCFAGCPPLWVSQPTGGPIDSSPAVANGVVFVGSGDDKLYAYPTSCTSPCAPLCVSQATGGPIVSSPVVSKVVYVASEDGKVYAFRASCSTPCSPLWVSQPVGVLQSSPAVANGVIYVGSFSDQKLYAFPTTCSTPCSPLWSSQATGGVIQEATPAVAGGVVYIGSRDAKLYAFPASCTSNCAPLWVSQATGGTLDLSSPAVANGVVYVGADKLYAFPTSCSTPCAPVWVSADIGSGNHSSPAVANGVVYVAAFDGTVGGFATACTTPCAPLWTGHIPPTESSPAVADGVVYIGSHFGELDAFDLPEPPQAPARPDPKTLVPDYSLSAWSSFPTR